MNTIEQPCPSCGRKLELPSTAIGRLAKCPACEATFTVAEESATPPVGGGEEPRQTAPRSTEPPPHQAAGGESDADRPPPGSPYSQPLTSGASFEIESGGSPMNPYQPTYAQDPVASVGQLQVVPRSIEDIFSPTLSIFGARWGPLVLAFLVVMAATFAIIVVPAVGLAAIADAGGEVAAVVGLMVSVPILLLLTCYVSVGLARNAIAVARNTPSPMMELLPPLGLVVRFLVGAVAMCLVAGLLGGIVVGLVVALIAVGGNQGLASLLGVLGTLGGMALAMVAYWLLWAWMFIVSDGAGTALGSIRAAYTLTMHNKMTSVLLVVIATVLSTAGTSACYVGLLVTQPLTNLMFAVAYLLMTNQQIDDPRLARQPYVESPPPTHPSF